MKCIAYKCKEKVEFEGGRLRLCNKHLMEFFYDAEERERQRADTYRRWYMLLLEWSVNVRSLIVSGMEALRIAKKPRNLDTLLEMEFWNKYTNIALQLEASYEGIKANEEAIRMNIQELGGKDEKQTA